MAKSFKNLRAKMSPAAKERSAEIACELRREIRLNELRGALDISQEELAELLNKKRRIGWAIETAYPVSNGYAIMFASFGLICSTTNSFGRSGDVLIFFMLSALYLVIISSKARRLDVLLQE